MRSIIIILLTLSSHSVWGENALTGSGTAIVRWATPTRTVDNACAGKISKYLIHYGNERQNFDTIKEIEANRVICTKVSVDTLCGLDIATCTHTLFDLSHGSWYFRVRAVDINGNKSSFSNKATKVIK